MTLTTTLASAPTDIGYEQLRPLMSLMTGDEKHTDAATSTLDVVWTLYDRVLNVDP
ncbi:MAG: transketolase, partial [Acidimicrobiia bacterium]